MCDIWKPSNCSDKSCYVGEHFDYENCKCIKKRVDKLVEFSCSKFRIFCFEFKNLCTINKKMTICFIIMQVQTELLLFSVKLIEHFFSAVDVVPTNHMYRRTHIYSNLHLFSSVG